MRPRGLQARGGEVALTHKAVVVLLLLLFAAVTIPQAHAAVVSKFVKDGFSEHHKTHELPAGMQSTLN